MKFKIKDSNESEEIGYLRLKEQKSGEVSLFLNDRKILSLHPYGDQDDSKSLLFISTLCLKELNFGAINFSLWGPDDILLKDYHHD